MIVKPAEIQVRFSDLDVLGHVNNSVYLSYFEMTRVHYFKELLGENWDWKKNGVLLARNEIDYLAPILLHHKPLVYMNSFEIGTKSFKLGYQIFVGNTLHTSGCSVLICFDAVTNQTIIVPNEMKKALEKIKNI